MESEGLPTVQVESEGLKENPEMGVRDVAFESFISCIKESGDFFLEP